MQKELPDDIKVAFEFDQSPYVTRAISSLTTEGILGALLTGLMVLIFLRDWRSALVVILNIPLAILFSIEVTCLVVVVCNYKGQNYFRAHAMLLIVSIENTDRIRPVSDQDRSVDNSTHIYGMYLN